MMDSTRSICQSCTMPLSDDPLGGGTEADGSKSPEFCSYCYHAGAFRDPKLTLEGMILKLKPISETMHLPPEVVSKSIQMLPTLKRWRSSCTT